MMKVNYISYLQGNLFFDLFFFFFFFFLFLEDTKYNSPSKLIDPFIQDLIDTNTNKYSASVFAEYLLFNNVWHLNLQETRHAEDK